MKRCLVALALLALVSVVGSAGTVGRAAGPTPGGSIVSPVDGTTTIIDGPSYTIPVEWTASCPLPSGKELRYHSWNVDIRVTRSSDGSVVGTQTIAYVGVTDSSSQPHTQGMVVTLADGVQTDSFNVRVTLLCDSNPPQVIGSASITLTRKTCDPNLLAKALREYDNATTFANAGVRELTQAAGDLREFRNDYTTESLEIGAEKLSLLQVLHTLDAGYELDTAEIAEVTGFYVGIGVLIEEIALKFYPVFTAHRDLTREAQADFNHAKEWSAQADADLAQALAQRPCLGPLEAQLNTLLDDQKKKEEARNLIDTWENNGYRYVSPINGEVLDEQAALKQARALIAGKSHLLQAANAKPKLKPTAKQAHAAVNALNHAIAIHAKAAKKIGLVTKANATLLARLQPLLTG